MTLQLILQKLTVTFHMYWTVSEYDQMAHLCSCTQMFLFLNNKDCCYQSNNGQRKFLWSRVSNRFHRLLVVWDTYRVQHSTGYNTPQLSTATPWLTTIPLTTNWSYDQNFLKKISFLTTFQTMHTKCQHNTHYWDNRKTNYLIPSLCLLEGVCCTSFHNFYLWQGVQNISRT
jgi:hypothetical protein